MLKSIAFENFKSLKKVSLSLAPVTLLTGLNNTGKSSVIEGIRMLWKSKERGDPVLDGHGALRELQSKSSARKAKTIVTYRFSGRNLCRIVIDNSGDRCKVDTSICEGLPLLSYVSADRWGPRVVLPISTATKDLVGVGDYGEYLVDYMSRYENSVVPKCLIHERSEGETLSYNVRGWVTEISPNIELRHETDEKHDVSHLSINGFRSTNSGFGVSYGLPVIVSILGMASLWLPPSLQQAKEANGGIVVIENPEAHLHPKGQTALGRLIGLAAKTGIQVVVETHSDYVIDGIRLAVKFDGVDPRKIKFHYFNLDVEGNTTIQTPTVDKNGKLDYWPEGFFDQALVNRARLART